MNRLRRTVWVDVGSCLMLACMLSACSTTPAIPPAAPAVQRSSQVAEESRVVQSLQKQLREREKRIEELESQLNVLKLIDQDLEKRKKPSRQPVTVTPSE